MSTNMNSLNRRQLLALSATAIVRSTFAQPKYSPDMPQQLDSFVQSEAAKWSKAANVQLD